MWTLPPAPGQRPSDRGSPCKIGNAPSGLCGRGEGTVDCTSRPTGGAVQCQWHAGEQRKEDFLRRQPGIHYPSSTPTSPHLWKSSALRLVFLRGPPLQHQSQQVGEGFLVAAVLLLCQLLRAFVKLAGHFPQPVGRTPHGAQRGRNLINPGFQLRRGASAGRAGFT